MERQPQQASWDEEADGGDAGDSNDGDDRSGGGWVMVSG